MADEIDKILESSGKADLLEKLNEALVTADKVVCVVIEDKEGGRFISQVITLGVLYQYEALGILDIAKDDIKEGY